MLAGKDYSSPEYDFHDSNYRREFISTPTFGFHNITPDRTGKIYLSSNQNYSALRIFQGIQSRECS